MRLEVVEMKKWRCVSCAIKCSLGPVKIKSGCFAQISALDPRMMSYNQNCSFLPKFFAACPQHGTSVPSSTWRLFNTFPSLAILSSVTVPSIVKTDPKLSTNCDTT